LPQSRTCPKIPTDMDLNFYLLATIGAQMMLGGLTNFSAA
jgi:hypothetical protein